MNFARSVLLASLAYASACLHPTEVTLVVTTDASCTDIPEVSISVGALGEQLEGAAASATATCVDGKLGSIVLVPSGSRDKLFGVRVVGGFRQAADRCVPPYGPSCVVARRAIHYVAHTPLTLPINIATSCIGVPCEATDTCFDGRCIPATVDPTKCDASSCSPSTDVQWEGCGDMSGVAKGAPWSMNSGCPTHTRRSPYKAATAPTNMRWEVAYPGSSYPAIGADGTVYFGNATSVMAVDGKTGKVRWQQSALASNVGGDGALGADGSFVIAADQSTYAFSASDGKPKWNPPYGGSSDLVIGAGQLAYALNPRGTLTALDAFGRASLGVALTHGNSGLSPAIGPDGTVYASPEGTIYAVDPVPPGKVKWTYTAVNCGVAVECLLGIAVANGTLYTVAPKDPNGSQYVVVALDAATGSELWKQPAAKGPPVIGRDGVVYVSGVTAIEGFDGRSGVQVSSAELGGSAFEMLLDASDALIAVMDTGKYGGQVIALDTKTQQVRWNVDSHGARAITLAADGTLVLVGTSSIFALGY